MSQERTVECGLKDLNDLEVYLHNQGLRTRRKVDVQLYRRTVPCDLVVDVSDFGNLNIGFQVQEDGTITAIYDDMIQSKYGEIISGYIEQKIESRIQGKYKILNKTKTRDSVVIELG